MTEPRPNPRIVTQTDVTTTRRVHAEFEGPRAGTDLTLAELRTAIEAAAHLPEHAIVRVHIREGWRTPSTLVIEDTDKRELPEPRAHDCTDDCDPGNCAVAHANEFGHPTAWGG